MAMPPSHEPLGCTICVHSLAVLPSCQRLGLGSTLLRSYLARMAGTGTADHVAIIAHEEMLSYYERFGFVNHGPSKAEFGGGGWYDMVCPLNAKS